MANKLFQLKVGKIYDNCSKCNGAYILNDSRYHLEILRNHFCYEKDDLPNFTKILDSDHGAPGLPGMK